MGCFVSLNCGIFILSLTKIERFILKKKWLVILFFHGFIVSWLASCEKRTIPAPVSELAWKPYHKNASNYHVRPGDTLYSIAFRYDMDVHKLATFNQLSAPFHLRSGQEIQLRSKLTQPKIKPYNQGKPLAKLVNTMPQPRVKKKTPTAMVLVRPTSWIWPVHGKPAVLYTFNPKVGKKGIDIVGLQNMPIRASAPGIVAYAGNGLPGYGNLILLKHGDHYLTAYAHNASLLVKEGQAIQSGQLIARMGRLDKQRWGLHFEIRKGGKPINPLNYLKKG